MDTPLRKIRKTLRLKQYDVATACGIPQPTFSKIESGTVTATPENAAAIAKHFGGAVTELHILYPERFPDFLGR